MGGAIGLELNILGPLEVLIDGTPVEVGAAKERALLVLLALHAGEVVSVDRLTEDLWDGEPPEQAATTLRVYVSHLRKVVPDGAIVTRKPGYLLDISPEQLDAHRFQAACERARVESDPQGRADLYRQALAMWRGAALSDVADQMFAVGEAHRLEEARFAGLEARIEADLARGAHAELVGELEMLTGKHALRERLWSHLITTLYRSGRQADALAAYRGLRARLADELGIDPSPELQELEAKVLAQDPVLSGPRTTSLPSSGILTFLFTDIEGSTKLWEDHAVSMGKAVARQEELIRRAVEEHGGSVFKTTGDGACAAFTGAREAIEAAVAAQRALDAEPWDGSTPIRVRMSVHTGPAARRGDDFFGSALNRSARLLDAGHGGQILVSEAAGHLVLGDLPEQVELLGLGYHRFRGLEQPQEVFQLRHPDLAQEFPPIRSEEERRTNLPAPVTSFVGRERELAAVATALSQGRVVTLTGVGGVGKTRLALQASAAALPDLDDGVWFCDLAPVLETDGVDDAVAAALGVPRRQGEPISDTLVEFCRPRDLMLVLDNCEHLLAGAVSLLEKITAACPKVTAIATSREALGIPGERVLGVPSLDVASPDSELESLVSAGAIRLFVERACAADASFELTVENAWAVAEICRRLDGIPLAIELAAARVRVMGPRDIAARLDERFQLLKSGGRSGVARHQTLRRAIDWSYDQLSPPERDMLNKLSAFSGTFTFDAVEAVAGGEGDPLDILAQLIDKSLVLSEAVDGSKRYRLLETIRQYAEERLEESDGVIPTRRRHAQHYAAVAERAGALLRGPDETTCAAIVDRELDNLLSAAAWCVSTRDVEGAFSILAPITGGQINVTAQAQLSKWAERALELPGAEENPRFDHVTGTAAAGAYFAHGRLEDAYGLLERAVAVARDRGRMSEYPVLVLKSALAWISGRTQEAEAPGRKAADRAVRENEPAWEAYALGQLAVAALTFDEGARGRELAEKAVLRANASGSGQAICVSNLILGVVLRDAGDDEGALAAFGRAITPETPPHWGPHQTAVFFDAGLKAERGEHREALRVFRREMQSWGVLTDRYLAPVGTLTVASVLAELGEYGSCGVLMGAVEAGRLGPYVPGSVSSALVRRAIKAALDRLGPEQGGAAAARGSDMEPAEVVAFAIAEIDRILAAREADR